MRKISIAVLLKNYIGLVAIMLLVYLVLGPNEHTSLPFVLLMGMPITAFMLYTGLDKKLNKFSVKLMK